MKHMVNPLFISYAAAGLCALSGLFAFLGSKDINFPLAVFAGLMSFLMAILTLFIYNAGTHILSIITSIFKIRQTFRNYVIPPHQKTIVKRANNLYYATAYIGINIIEANVKKTIEEGVYYNVFFERAIASLKFPVKLSAMTFIKNISKYRTNLQAKKAEYQLRLSKEREKDEPDPITMERYEKTIAEMESELNLLTKGIKPIVLVMFASTTAAGISEEDAVKRVLEQQAELKAVLTNTLNLETQILKAKDMITCYVYDYNVPVEQTDLEYSVI